MSFKESELGGVSINVPEKIPAAPVIESICQIIENKELNLKALFLNKCGLRDKEAVRLFESIQASEVKKLEKLYINSNLLTNVSGLRAAELL
jgi:hypothetical protein